MCAGSGAKIGELEVGVYMGYYGGSIDIGDIKYKVNEKDPEKEMEGRAAVKAKLMEFSSEQLTELILDLVKNSDE
jgi:hypothetical protein